MAANAIVSKLETEAKEFRGLEKEISNMNQKRAQLLTQLNENEMVLQELKLLNSDAEVYKLIGPVLVKQEQSEAATNVQKRIDFIGGELKRLETTYTDSQKKFDEKRKKLMDLQLQAQQLTQQPKK
eukprot:TRINITY_DN3264_c0_g2_i1.p1 TRINITY_DN3264_c0_g2~~TRINITY_DN3264_c0_g2_i1.p1  ORF type:complete len:126 (+),score=27.58 TRINITY_DN3264_c0_g2_i1:95-472(+)